MSRPRRTQRRATARSFTFDESPNVNAASPAAAPAVLELPSPIAAGTPEPLPAEEFPLGPVASASTSKKRSAAKSTSRKPTAARKAPKRAEAATIPSWRERAREMFPSAAPKRRKTEAESEEATASEETDDHFAPQIAGILKKSTSELDHVLSAVIEAFADVEDELKKRANEGDDGSKKKKRTPAIPPEINVLFNEICIEFDHQRELVKEVRILQESTRRIKREQKLYRDRLVTAQHSQDDVLRRVEHLRKTSEEREQQRHHLELLNETLTTLQAAVESSSNVDSGSKLMETDACSVNLAGSLLKLKQLCAAVDGVPSLLEFLSSRVN